MGILNITPDSFSDGGEFNAPEAFLAQAHRLVEAGADILDIGGQSTRPGAEQIPLEEELNRVIPAIQAVRSHLNCPVSVDTTRASVAKAAVEAGADIVNDISGGTFNPDMLTTVAQLRVPIVLMHIRGTPQTMSGLTQYENLVRDIYSFLNHQVQAALEAGVARSQIIIDPGIGFAKTYRQSLELLRRLPEFRTLNVPMLVGPSRKSFIGRVLNRDDPKLRVWGTAAAVTSAIAGGADIVRVHDVEMSDVCRVADAIWREEAEAATSN